MIPIKSNQLSIQSQPLDLAEIKSQPLKLPKITVMVEFRAVQGSFLRSTFSWPCSSQPQITFQEGEVRVRFSFSFNFSRVVSYQWSSPFFITLSSSLFRLREETRSLRKTT
ncbi:hypothetical protein Hanom_Chr10g00882361 [Helianthus anomalus]